MNHLSIEKRDFRYTLKNVEQLNQQSEFIVDGIALSELLSFSEERPLFGETFIDNSSEPFARTELSAFLGETKATNQFGTERLVLYRCHCGSDYCGVVSCEIERVGNSIYWKNVSYEDDLNNPEVTKYDYEFNFQDYKNGLYEILNLS